MAEMTEELYKALQERNPEFSVDVFGEDESYRVVLTPAWADNIVPEGLQPLAAGLRRAWTLDSSASDEWDARRPETGQCAVTALIVQDHHGGDLLRAIVNGESHYWNRLPDGTEVDLTRAQFDLPLTIGEVVVRESTYVLANPATNERYETLRRNVNRLG